MPLPAPAHRRPTAPALAILAVLALASGLGAGTSRSGGAVPWRTLEVSARGVPGFGLIPLSRREDAVLRSQPELQILAAGSLSLRAKPARPQAGRTGRLGARGGQARRGSAGGDGAGRPSGAAAVRLR